MLLGVNLSLSGICRRCLNISIINSIILSCFEFLDSAYRQYAKCSINIEMAFGLINASLYDLNML